jgi:hypothetical protein
MNFRILHSLLMLLASFQAYAEYPQSSDEFPQSRYEFDVGNDAFNPKPTDKHFTNSGTLGYRTNSVPEILRKSFNALTRDADATIYGLSLSQFIFTPKDLNLTSLIPDDRPYAGSLFASGIIAARKGNSLVLYGVDVGVVGPASLAEEMQGAWHDVIGKRHAKGWENQLDNEFGINFLYKRSKSFRKDGLVDRELILDTGVSLGNMNTHAEVGGAVRVGYNIPDDMGMGIGGNNKLSVYGIMKINQRVVLRDIFLDGNTFGDSHYVHKNMNVTTASAGIVVRYKNFEMEYKYEYMTEQFKNQKGPDVNGVISFIYNKRF